MFITSNGVFDGHDKKIWSIFQRLFSATRSINRKGLFRLKADAGKKQSGKTA